MSRFYTSTKNKVTDGSLKIDGGINISSRHYGISNMPARDDPWTWDLNARLNLNFYQVNIPISYVTSSKRSVLNYGYEIPSFNFSGMSPSYKWIKLHLGDRSLNLSQYSFSGHNFRGAGLELTPGNWHIMGFSGRLVRANAEDLTTRQNIDPVFERNGWGAKVGYQKDQSRIELHLFKAKDDPQSIDVPLNSGNILPSENVVVGMAGGTGLGPMTIDFEYALSGFTRDLNSPDLSSEDLSAFRSYLGLLDVRTSTGYYSALNGSLSFATKIGNFGFSYEWVEPEYRTLGALFFNNDFENYTVDASFRAFKNKLSLNTSLGLQRNNRSGLKTTEDQRFITNSNISFNANESLAFQINYSNFRTTNKFRIQEGPITFADSLTLQNINQNIGFVSTLSLDDQASSSLQLSVTYQNTNGIENDVILENQRSNFVSGLLTFNTTIEKGKTSISSGLMYNRNSTNGIVQTNFSPTVSFSRPFWDDFLKWTSTLSYMFQENVSSAQIFVWNNSLNIKVLEGHIVGVRGQLVNRNQRINQDQTGFTEWRASISYGWNFSKKLKIW